MRNAFAAARCGIELLAEEQQDLRDLPPRLTCAVVLLDRLAIGQLGDGAIVVRDEAGSYSTARRAQRGEYVMRPIFIPGRRLDHVEIRRIDGAVQALAAMSDGLTRLALKMPASPTSLFFSPCSHISRKPLRPIRMGKPSRSAAFCPASRVSAHGRR